MNSLLAVKDVCIHCLKSHNQKPGLQSTLKEQYYIFSRIMILGPSHLPGLRLTTVSIVKLSKRLAPQINVIIRLLILNNAHFTTWPPTNYSLNQLQVLVYQMKLWFATNFVNAQVLHYLLLRNFQLLVLALDISHYCLNLCKRGITKICSSCNILQSF